MLKDRQKSILHAVIETHLKTAEPVSSQEVMRLFRARVSPATIRHEMVELDKGGFLEQPHTSAGRVPTDKGYRFFVDHLIDDAPLTAQEIMRIDALFSIHQQDIFIREFSKTIAHLSGMLTAVGCADTRIFYETGFSEILDEPEFMEPERIKEFGFLADTLEEMMHSMVHKELPAEHIFIGGGKPLRIARSYTMIVSPWQHKQFEGFVTLVGPKRTDYARHKAILNHIKEYTI